MQMEQVNMAQALTGIASVEMGEGAEQTPVAVITDITNIEFQDHEPTQTELDNLHIELEDDVYAPVLMSTTWQKGGGGQKK
jgi:F420-0:gamma-glutamyl ligase